MPNVTIFAKPLYNVTENPYDKNGIKIGLESTFMKIVRVAWRNLVASADLSPAKYLTVEGGSPASNKGKSCAKGSATSDNGKVKHTSTRKRSEKELI